MTAPVLLPRQVAQLLHISDILKPHVEETPNDQ
jgi:hypothetical protein